MTVFFQWRCIQLLMLQCSIIITLFYCNTASLSIHYIIQFTRLVTGASASPEAKNGPNVPSSICWLKGRWQCTTRVLGLVCSTDKFERICSVLVMPDIQCVWWDSIAEVGGVGLEGLDTTGHCQHNTVYSVFWNYPANNETLTMNIKCTIHF